MRAPSFRILLAALGLLVSPACSSCVDHPAEPVTLRVVNNLDHDVFVADEFEQLGLTVMRDQGTGDWKPMAEFATCDCQECSVACDACQCPQKPLWIKRIPSKKSAERVWQGEYRGDDKVNCYNGDVKVCLGDRLAAQPGRYRLMLCYASSVPGAPATGDRFEGTMPTDANQLDCGSAIYFEIPSSDPIVIQTDEPPGCRGPQDCPTDQMCLSGQCSATCLPNLVPKIGGDWTVEVGQPDNFGFFKVTDGANGAKIYKGTGTVDNARYTSGTTNLSLTRTENGIDLTASLYYTLPAKRALPLLKGDEVEVTVVDYVSGTRKMSRGISIKRAGKLALAADNGYDGPALDAAATLPFTVRAENDVFACEAADCGKRLHRYFQVGGGAQDLVLEAGNFGTVKSGSDTYEVVSVANYRDEVDGCGPRPMTPYVILLQDL
ncbi:MAG: hypothetical protein QM765_12125 [Myxococcales bacterium]